MYHQQRKLPLEIKKSNELVRSQICVENNALANKIFAALIRNLVEDSFPEVSIPVSQITIAENSYEGGRKYRQIKTAARVLMRATVDSLRYDGKGREIAFKMVNIFASCEYENGLIKATFSSILGPHLMGLKNYFTRLNYFELMELSSFYSQRLYELLKSWERPEGFCEITLAALYDLISYPQEQRADFASVRRNALEQAEKDINEKTELKFRWEPIKEGRKVVAVRFVIGEQGHRTQKKLQTKKSEKERQEGHEAAARRKPHLEAARQCRIDHGMKAGDTCKSAKPRSKKCKLCAQTANITYYSQDSLFGA